MPFMTLIKILFFLLPEETPEIEAHPTDMVATDGDKLLIPCKVRASPPATISWFRNR